LEGEAMNCYLYCNRLKPPDKELSRNRGIADVFREPERFRYKGRPLVVVDTAAMAQQDLRFAYIAKPMRAAANRDYEVEAVFGLGTSRGILFGTVVPALIVESESGEVIDVYPHRKVEREVTVREVLELSESGLNRSSYRRRKDQRLKYLQ
jgi:hypothetical protein